MITRIEAHNYRCFPQLAIDLDRYHILAGANGAGKTTLLDIPVLLGDLSQRGGVVAAFLERQGSGRAPRAGTLAATMSVKNCQDPAFNQLRAWFPEQP